MREEGDLSFFTGQGNLSVRVRAIMIHEGKLLIMRDIEPNWYLTGGRARRGETLEESLKREIREELGAEAEIVRPLWLNEAFYMKRGHKCHDITFFFLVDIAKTDILSRGDEFITMENGIPHIYSWVFFRDIHDMPFFRPFIIDRLEKLPESMEIVTTSSLEFEGTMDLSFTDNSRNFHIRTAAIYLYDDKLLAMRDTPDAEWYIPGGKVKIGESFEAALERETAEELGIPSAVIRPVWVHQNFYTKDGIDTHSLSVYYLTKVDDKLLSLGSSFKVGEHCFEWLNVSELSRIAINPPFIKTGVSETSESLELIASV